MLTAPALSFPPRPRSLAGSSAALFVGVALSGFLSLGCGSSKAPGGAGGGVAGAAGMAPVNDSGGRGGASAAGGAGGVSSEGGAGGGDVGGAAAGGSVGGAGGGAPLPHVEGTLELLAGAMAGQGMSSLGGPGGATAVSLPPPVGFGPDIYLPPYTRGMAVANSTVYVAPGAHLLATGITELQRQPYTLDLVSHQASAIPQLTGAAVLAAAFATDGLATLYVASPDCAAYRLGPGEQSPTMLSGPRACSNSWDDVGPIVTDIGLASLGGHVYLVGGAPGVLDIDPTTQLGTVIPGTDSLAKPSTIAAGSDGMLYVSSGGQVFRVDPVLGGAVPFMGGGGALAADGAGHLFLAGGDTVFRIELATGTRVIAAGNGNGTAITPGALPGDVGLVTALATTPSGDLVIASYRPYSVILKAHFSSLP